MGRGLSLGFIFVIMIGMIGVAEAACTNDNQTIIRLGSETNAHGAIWNQTQYSVRICYNDIFGKDYTGEGAHDCTGNNRVLSLYSIVNSHATIDTSYTVPICHKGLKDCEAKYNQPCSGGKYAVVYLSSMLNAHLSKISSPGYNYTICCNATIEGVSPPVNTPSRCQHYDNASYPSYYGQASCNSDLSGLRVASSDIGCTISDKTKCYCIWDSTKPVNQRCNVAWDASDAECNYRCVKTVSGESECDDITGMKTVALKAEIVPIAPSTAAQCAGIVDSGCQDGTIEDVPCGLIELDMPFFGWFNFAIAVVSITLAYLILIRKY